MIQVLVGDRGAGKTKKLISIANESAGKSNGHLVYISNNSESMFQLDSSVRLIDISSFPISSIDSLTGFIYGVLSQDYDIETIFIDNLSCILNDNHEDVAGFLKSAQIVSKNENVKFVFGIKCLKGEIENIEAEYLAV